MDMAKSMAWAGLTCYPSSACLVRDKNRKKAEHKPGVRAQVCSAACDPVIKRTPGVLASNQGSKYLPSVILTPIDCLGLASGTASYKFLNSMEYCIVTLTQLEISVKFSTRTPEDTWQHHPQS